VVVQAFRLFDRTQSSRRKLGQLRWFDGARSSQGKIRGKVDDLPAPVAKGEELMVDLMVSEANEENVAKLDDLIVQSG
jgi:hypothetical protein